MAKITGNVFWGLQKQLGNLIFYKMDGKHYVRSKPLSVRNPKTPAQMACRRRFAIASQWSGTFSAAIFRCWGERTLIELRRLFISLNIRQIVVDTNMEEYICWENIKLTEGNIVPPQVSVKRGEAKNELCFLRKKQKYQKNCVPYDRMYAIVVDVVKGEAIGYSLELRTDSGRITVVLPSSGNWDHICIYAFAISCDNQTTSRSVFVGRFGKAAQ